MVAPVREEPTVDEEHSANVWPARSLPALDALEPASKVLEDDERREVAALGGHIAAADVAADEQPLVPARPSSSARNAWCA